MNIRHIVVIGIYVCLCLKSTDGRHKRETEKLRLSFMHGPCDPNPCQNGGTCTVDGTDYTCSCTSQFRGRDCDNIDECNPDPCQNGATCTDGVDSYTCTCVAGYTGTNCETVEYCPAYWYLFKGSCYYIMNTFCTWLQAEHHCIDLGGHLVEITSEQENNFITSIMRNLYHVWIGLNDIVTEGVFVWISSKNTASGVYTNWGRGQPNNSDNTDCVAIHYSQRDWINYYCSEDWHFICEKKSMLSSLTTGVWIGLKWHNYKATYIWVTSGTVQTYTNWQGGYGKGFSNVICYEFDPSNGFWYELDCSMSSNYICEKEAADDPCFPNPCQNEGTCITNGADYTCNCQSGSKGEKCETSGYCQPGWSHYGRKCYKFSSNTKTWEAAKLACVADESAYLVEIMSAEENSFLQTTGSEISTLTTSVWLGLQWHYTKDDFYWVTSGTLYPYRNWGNGPRSPDFHCYKLGLSHGYWDPYDCSTSSDYICEKAATDDPCTERPCKNGGTCTSQSGSYTCT